MSWMYSPPYVVDSGLPELREYRPKASAVRRLGANKESDQSPLCRGLASGLGRLLTGQTKTPGHRRGPRCNAEIGGRDIAGQVAG